MDKNEKRGEEIIKAVYKASLTGLFAIGVRSPQYVNSFTLAFTEALDKEFLKIGLLSADSIQVQQKPLLVDKPQPEPESNTTLPNKSVEDSIDALGLNALTQSYLLKAHITTISKLMESMQKDSLTAIKGIGKKSAHQILTALERWNKIS